MLTLQRLFALLIAVAFVSGCGSSATLTLRDGRTMRGKIVRGDPTYVYVKQRREERYVRRDDIADVSHPGTAAMYTGAALLGVAGFFVANAAVNLQDEQTQDCGIDCQSEKSDSKEAAEFFLGAAVLSAGAGVGIGTFGLARHLSSHSRYASPPFASPPPAPTKGAKGLKLGFEF